jgi:excisionase family DNA binding protein
MQEQWLTLTEAAKALRMSRSRLYELHESGSVPGRQLNGRGRILFRLSELEAALITKPKKAPSNG